MNLIVNADDFGLTSGVNQGVLDCYLNGSVSSATLMLNTSATDEAVKIAYSHPDLGVGLHFNLTLGEPLSNVGCLSSLVDGSGSFYSRQKLEKRLFLRQIRTADIEVEFLAQVNRFHDFGLSMTHIDSHQHMHLFPQVFDVVASYCAKYKIPLRVPWLWRERSGRFGWKKQMRSRVLGLLLGRNWKKWGGKIIANAGFRSIFDLVSSPDQISSNHFTQLVAPGKMSPMEIMVHPARVDNALASLTRITDYSRIETEYLTDLSLKELAALQGWRFVSYRDAFSSGSIVQ